MFCIEMIEVYKILNQFSNDTSLLRNDRLLFDFTEYEIVFDLPSGTSEQIEEDLFYRSLSEKELEEFSRLEPSASYIGSSEYLGYRNDIIDYSEPFSICNKMYEAIQIIQEIDQDSVKEYFVSQNEGYNEDFDAAAFCDTEPNYIFEIHIADSYISNSNFYNEVIDKLRFANDSYTPPEFYWVFYKNYEKIPDNRRLSILNTNTKVRRLGYFKLLLKFLQEQEKVPSNFINKKFERFVEEYRTQLGQYKNDKGLIKVTKNGTSAAPYIEVAKDLGFLNLLNNVYSSGKLFKVFGALNKELGVKSENAFALAKLDKLFFLETILREDFLYTSIILEHLKLNRKSSFQILLKSFQQLLLKRLKQLSDLFWFEKNSAEYKELKRIIDRIQNWKNPEVYLEHVLMPRLNWLYDLELIEIDLRLNLKLSNKGVKLFSHICYWNDINWSRVVSPNDFLNRFMVHMYDDIYNGEKTEISKNEVVSNTISCLMDSFKYFKTLAPNRVTASQAITYAKYKLYLTHNIKVGHQFIVNYLKSKEQDLFIYKFQKQYGDGYIQKILK